jgi:hypothetical protein
MIEEHRVYVNDEARQAEKFHVCVQPVTRAAAPSNVFGIISTSSIFSRLIYLETQCYIIHFSKEMW